MKRQRSSTTPVETVEAAVERFIDYCRGKGLQPSTINRSYAPTLHQKLLPFCAHQGIRTLDELTPEALSRFAAELHAGKLAKYSIAAYIRSVNRFLSWTGRRLPDEKAPRPQTRRVHRDVLTLSEMRQLEEAASTVRNQLIVRVLADTGCRLGECAALRTGDVVMRGREWYVRISGKTGERMPPIQEEVYDRLRSFIARGRKPASNDFLFLSAHRNPKTGEFEGLQAQGVYQALKDVAAATRWNRRIYPHLLRHSAITRAVTRGMHPALVSEIFGVSVEVVAEHYSHASDRERHAAMMRVLTGED